MRSQVLAFLPLRSFEEFGFVSPIDGVLVGRVAVRLEGRDERLEAGREDNEVAVAGRGDVCVA